MPLPTLITDLSTTAASNFPSGSDSPSVLDDVQRAHAAFIAQLRDRIVFPVGTRLPFAQSAAPTGWTQDVSDSASNRMLRVVTTAGNGIGGSSSPILNDVVPSHTHTFTTGTESASHTHNVSDPGHAHSLNLPNSGAGSGGGSYTAIASPNNSTALVANAATTGISLSGQTVNHTHSGTTGANGTPSNWTPRYIDLIICSQN